MHNVICSCSRVLIHATNEFYADNYSTSKVSKQNDYSKDNSKIVLTTETS